MFFSFKSRVLVSAVLFLMTVVLLETPWKEETRRMLELVLQEIDPAGNVLFRLTGLYHP